MPHPNIDESEMWIDDHPDSADISEWFGVVAESRGGIVAYFGRREDAESYIAVRKPIIEPPDAPPEVPQ